MIRRWLQALREWWLKTMYPFHCFRCGKHYRKMNLLDLPPEVRKMHLRAGTAEMVLRYAYKCDACHKDGMCMMIYF